MESEAPMERRRRRRRQQQQHVSNCRTPNASSFRQYTLSLSLTPRTELSQQTSFPSHALLLSNLLATACQFIRFNFPQCRQVPGVSPRSLLTSLQTPQFHMNARPHPRFSHCLHLNLLSHSRCQPCETFRSNSCIFYSGCAGALQLQYPKPQSFPPMLSTPIIWHIPDTTHVTVALQWERLHAP
jgi:hypothetical protein